MNERDESEREEKAKTGRDKAAERDRSGNEIDWDAVIVRFTKMMRAMYRKRS